MLNKKIILVLLSVILFSGAFAQRNNVIERAASKLTTKITTKLKKELKSKKGKDKIKIVVMNFTKDGTNSRMTGCEITKKLSHSLSKNKLFNVLIENQSVNSLMAKGISDPNITNLDYYKDKLKGRTPDYNISGKYEISEDYKTFSLKNVVLHKHDDINKTTIGIENVKCSNLTPKDRFYLIDLETVENIPQLCDYMTLTFKKQTNIKNINLSNFVYKENGLPSEFSEELSEKLAQKLRNVGDYKVTRSIIRNSFNKLTVDHAPHTLSGTYKKEGDRLKINAILKNENRDEILRTEDFYIHTKYFTDSQINYYIPENEVSSQKNSKKWNKEFDKEPVVDEETVKNKFKINITTNKGNDNVVFREGEVVEFTVTASEPCYLRFIYILATGEPVLLIDNIKIKKGKYKIKDIFYCAEPFGAEILYLSAQTDEKFDTLEVDKINGYKFIKGRPADILKINRSKRGLKKDGYAERKINFVTSKK